jgi:putative hemin transport protein
MTPKSTPTGPVWLEPRWSDLVEALSEVGPIRVTTENRAARLSKTGPIEKVSFDRGPVGLVVGEQIDLRLLTHKWERARATESGILIEDPYGRPTMRVEQVETSKDDAYLDVLDAFRAEQPIELDEQASPDLPSMSVEDVDARTHEAFRRDWLGMEDTHEFHGILQEHGLERHVAVKLAPECYAKQLEPSILERVVNEAARREIPLMVFVSSEGCVQIHKGRTEWSSDDSSIVRLTGPTLEMDIDSSRLDEAWAVKKPTEGGGIHSLEFFDDVSELSFQVFGKRESGNDEREDWRDLVKELSA